MVPIQLLHLVTDLHSSDMNFDLSTGTNVSDKHLMTGILISGSQQPALRTLVYSLNNLVIVIAFKTSRFNNYELFLQSL